MNWPNRFTFLRLLLTPLVLVAVLYAPAGAGPWKTLALAGFLIAIATDALDGILARTLNQRTSLGTFLDPLADKLLLAGVLVALAVSGGFDPRPPAWYLVVVLSRDVLIVLGYLALFLGTGQSRIEPSLSGKVTTFLQMVTLLMLLAEQPGSQMMFVLTTAMTCISGVGYFVRYCRQAGGP